MKILSFFDVPYIENKIVSSKKFKNNFKRKSDKKITTSLTRVLSAVIWSTLVAKM